MQNVKKPIITLLCALFSISSFAQTRVSTQNDSITKAKKAHLYHIKSTVRLHNKGMFLYGGRLSTENPALDFNFTYTRPAWGFMVYKALDLTDHTTNNNFTLATFFKNFKVSERLTVTPYAGLFLEQLHSFADEGSDLLALAVINYKANPKLNVEYTTLLPNLVVEPNLRDWVNRFRVLYSHRHWDITGAFWHNNEVFDEANYTSAALTVGYSRIPLSDSFNFNISATELAMVQSSNEEETPKTYRFMVTASVQFVK
jgi:hypothetical protein